MREKKRKKKLHRKGYTPTEPKELAQMNSFVDLEEFNYNLNV